MKKLAIVMIFLGACQFRLDDEDAKDSVEYAIEFADLKIDGRNIHYAYTNRGKSEMLVFIHGSPGSWRAFIDFFNNESLLSNFDLLAVDRPGFGQSDFGTAETSLEVQASLVNNVLMKFPQKGKILLGHSLGGPVAARMAMDYPYDYKGMILIAPSIDPDLEKEEWYRKVIKTKFGAFFTPKEFEVSNEEILALKSELVKMQPLWKNVTIPTIVIQGSSDSLVPKENADFAQKMLPDSLVEVIILDDVNHFIPWTHPEVIIKAVNQLTEGY